MSVQHSSPDGVASPTGAYSLVSVAPLGSSLAWIAGQTGRNPDGTFEESPYLQARRALSNLEALLEAISASPLDILTLRTLLVGRQAMAGFVRAREERFAAWYPAAPPPSSTVAFVAGLADIRAVVEIEAVVASSDENRPDAGGSTAALDTPSPPK